MAVPFVERAQATRSRLLRTQQNAEAVMSICVGLEDITVQESSPPRRRDDGA